MLLLVLAVGSRSAGAADPRAMREGTHEGAEFTISIPSSWNGGLVMYAHGYEGEGPGLGGVRASPLDFHLTEGGYAWAASGYRSKGYRPDWFLADMQALRARFIKEFGQPRWTIIHGQSMGGHVAVASLELHPEIYQGALVECGVVDGVGLMDWLYAYTAAAEYFSATPLLDTPRPDFDALATVAWPKLMGTPGDYTERGRHFDSVIKHLSGGDVPLRLEGMKQRYFLNLNPRQQSARGAQEFARHADTRHVRYDIDPGHGLDAAELNRDIRRVTACLGRTVTRGEPRIRGDDRKDPSTALDDPRDSGLPGAVPTSTRLSPPCASRRDRPPFGATRGAPSGSLRHRRHGARARLRRSSGMDGTRNHAGR